MEKIRHRALGEFDSNPNLSSPPPPSPFPGTVARIPGHPGGTASSLLNGSKPPKGKKTPKPLTCTFCSESHHSDRCQKYPDLKSRKEKVKGLCIRCLLPDHKADKCPQKGWCFHCKESNHHHRALCPKKFGNGNLQEVLFIASSLDPEAEPFVPFNLFVSGNKVMMQTAIVEARDASGKHAVRGRAVFDTASSRSYVTLRFKKQLHAQASGETVISLAGFGDSSRKSKAYKIIPIDIKLDDCSLMRLELNAVEVISCPVQKCALDTNATPVLKQCKLAEPISLRDEMVEIDMLIGLDYYYQIIQVGGGIDCGNGLFLLQSRLGFIPTGRIPDQSPGDTSPESSLFLSVAPPDPDFSLKDVHKFFSLEAVGLKDDDVSDPNEDEAALRSFNDTVKFENGRYSVTWPWKSLKTELPSNYGLALGRLKSLHRRIGKDKALLKTYDDTINGQLAAGMIEPVEAGTVSSLVHYMPHHCVVTPSKATTKVRIVFDASSKANRSVPSLNDCFYRGPVMLSDLCGMLLRLRLHNIALISDIEKAFLQVGIQTHERDVTRFLWMRDISKPPTMDNLVIFRFCRVPFGIICSPFLLAATVAHHLRQANSPVALQIASNCYVDNVITGTDTITNAKAFYREAKQLFSSASMNLREWNSNSAEFLQMVADKDRSKDLNPKVLGVAWCRSQDALCCSLTFDADNVSTKRQILQAASKVYDPCGFFSPVTLQGKLLMQRVWCRQISWDETLPDDLAAEWKSVSQCYVGLDNIPVPRFLGSFGSSCNLQLHCFCDASAKAYAASVYLRIQMGESCLARLVFSKARVSPLKPLTIPRLELMAVLTGAQVSAFVKKEYRLGDIPRFVWTDSTTVLHWIQSATMVKTSFVEKSLLKIRSHNDAAFRFVPGKENPADLASRGCDSSTLKSSSNWWNGPDFLIKPEEQWPEQKVVAQSELPEEDQGETVIVSVENPYPELFDLCNYSSLLKVLRITAWIIRFVSNAKGKGNGKVSGPLKACEIHRATIVWVRSTQHGKFPELFTEGKSSAVQKSLKLFTDQDGIKRVSSRLDYSGLPYSSINPILLPAGTYFTRLVIIDAHSRLCHSGATATLAYLRKQFWVTKGMSEVKRVVKDCRTCRRHEGKTFVPADPPPLPSFRVTRSSPFSHVGIDYMGPLTVRTPNEKSKVWICLFTCAVTRAVHLEVVDDLTAEQFILALRRFASIRVKPTMIISDNATNFQLSSRALVALQREQSVQDYTSANGIEWKFITPLAPWMGGFYERMIGTVKRSLRKVLGSRSVTLVELITIAHEVSSAVNSRPLCKVSDDADHDILTPNHFLGKTGESELSVGPSVSDDDYKPSDANAQTLIRKWRRTEALSNMFWRSWRLQYLQDLRSHSMRSRKGKPSFAPQLGVVVLIKDDNLPRGRWRFGKISKLHQSFDGKCRSADVKLANGHVLERSISLLYPLEMSEDPQVAEAEATDPATDRKPHNDRPKRKAASEAAKKIKQSLESSEDESE